MATDTSTVSISNSGVCTIADSTSKTLTLRSDLGIIYPTNVSSLNLISRPDGLSVDGGGLQLFAST